MSNRQRFLLSRCSKTLAAAAASLTEGGGRRRRRRRRADWWDKQDFLRVYPGEKEGFAKSAGENVVKKIQRNLSILSSAYLEGEGGGAINLENFLLRLLGDSQVEGRGGRKGGSGARWGGGDITIGAFRLLLLLLRRPACRLDGVTAWTKKKIRGNDFVLDEREERGGGGMIWTRQNGGGGGGAVSSVLNGMGGGESSLLLFFAFGRMTKETFSHNGDVVVVGRGKKVEEKIFICAEQPKEDSTSCL